MEIAIDDFDPEMAVEVGDELEGLIDMPRDGVIRPRLDGDSSGADAEKTGTWLLENLVFDCGLLAAELLLGEGEGFLEVIGLDDDFASGYC